jgi:hypothetical protein
MKNALFDIYRTHVDNEKTAGQTHLGVKLRNIKPSQEVLLLLGTFSPSNMAFVINGAAFLCVKTEELNFLFLL